MATTDPLGIYLEDHLGGSAAGIQLAERLRDQHEGTSLGAVMTDLVEQIGQDKGVLEGLIERVGPGKPAVKHAAGWVLEKASRLRLNPQLTGSEELTVMLEAEALSLGIEGKRLMWLALRRAAGADARLAGPDYDELVERAERQRRTLEPHRVEAALKAFSESPSARP